MELELRPKPDIRGPAFGDAIKIMQLCVTTWRETYPNAEYDITPEWLEQETEEWFAEDVIEHLNKDIATVEDNVDRFYRIATSGESIVGMVEFGTKDDGTKHLMRMYFTKDMQGTGLAQEMIDQGLAWAEASDIVLEVVDYNERAKAFYRRNGFQPTGNRKTMMGKIPQIEMIREVTK